MPEKSFYVNNKNMQKITLTIFLTFIFLILPIDLIKAETKNEIKYYDQNYELCYTGCAAWKMYWQNDTIWNYIHQYCTINEKKAAFTLVKFAFNTLRGGVDFGPFIQSLYCIGFIKLDTAPKLQECQATCQQDMWTYAPDLAIAHGEKTGITYFPKKQKLQIKIYNIGYVYSPNFKVDVYQAETDDVNCNIKNNDWQKLTSYEISELAPYNILKNKLQIPSQDTHFINWTAPQDKCVKIKIIIDPDNRIPELDESHQNQSLNNISIYTINNAPQKATYQIKDIKTSLLKPQTASVQLKLKIYNYGDKNGLGKLKISNCYKKDYLYATKNNLSIPAHDYLDVDLKLHNLFLPYQSQDYLYKCLNINFKDQNENINFQINTPIFSGDINGVVLDSFGEKVKNAEIKLFNNSFSTTTITNDQGYYQIKGITETGKYKILAKKNENESSIEEINFKLDPDPRKTFQNNLHFYKKILLIKKTKKLKINCSTKDFGFKLTSPHFTYQGISPEYKQELLAIIPDKYQLILYKPGYSTLSQKIDLQNQTEQTINCQLTPIKLFYSDQNIQFKPVLKKIWQYDLPQGYSPKKGIIAPNGRIIYLAISNYHKKDYRILIFNQQGIKLGETKLKFKKNFENIYIQPTYNGERALIDNYLLINQQGHIIKQKQTKYKYPIFSNLSWDGSLICDSHGLYNQNFKPIYTGFWGQELDIKHTLCQHSQFGNFNSLSNILDICSKKQHQICELSFFEGLEKPIITIPDSNFWRFTSTPDNKIQLITFETKDSNKYLAYIKNNQLIWKQKIHYSNSSISLSPEGKYALLINKTTHDIQIFNDQGQNLLPKNQNFNSDFLDIKASGQGIFYLTYDGSIKFGIFGKKSKSQTKTLNQILENNQYSKKQKINQNQPTQNQQPSLKKTTTKQGLLGRLWLHFQELIKKIFYWIFK